ncbi:MAG: hypothetical protein RXR06_08860 [Thermoproteus sp.]
MGIYFIIDNKYSKELIKKLINIIRNKFVDVGIAHVSRPVNVCSNKMERFIEEGLEEGHCVIIIVDTEGDKPEDVEARIINEHFNLEVNNHNRVKIITAHPCLEAWLAELLNLNTRGVANSKNIKDIIKRHIKDYESHLLPGLIERHLRNRLEVGDTPSFLVEIVDAIRSC